MIVTFIIIVIFTIYAIILNSLYRNHNYEHKLKTTIPKSNSAELKYYYKGVVNERDLASLIITLGQKGYLKINKKEKYRIIKLKEYKGNNQNEKKLFNTIFQESNVVPISELHKNLYFNVSDIIHAIDTKEKRKEIQEKEELVLNNNLVILTFIIFLLISRPLEYNIIKKLIISLLTWASFVSLIRVYTSANNKRSKIFVTLLTIIVSLPFYFQAIINLINRPLELSVYVLGHIATIVIINTLSVLSPKTLTGNELKEEAKDFNNFMINADNEMIEKILKINPHYLEQTYSYAYAFNHNFKWIKLMKKYNKKLKWFEGNEFELSEVMLKIKNQIVKSGHKEE